MLTVSYIRDNRDLVVNRLKIKNFNQPEIIDRVIDLDNSRRAGQHRTDEMQNELNIKSKEIGKLFKSGNAEEANRIKAETLELKDSERSIRLEGVRRVRRNHNFRERPVYVMNNRDFYMKVISKCEEFVLDKGDPRPTIDDILDIFAAYQSELVEFALQHQRFCVLGLSIQEPEELYQIANHYLDDYPEMQARLSQALHDNLYKIDYFLYETDTLIAKDKIRINLCGHDAYGIDTVRNPMWSVYWPMDKHESMVKEFKKRGFKTGDIIGIEIDSDEKPIVYRL